MSVGQIRAFLDRAEWHAMLVLCVCVCFASRFIEKRARSLLLDITEPSAVKGVSWPEFPPSEGGLRPGTIVKTSQTRGDSLAFQPYVPSGCGKKGRRTSDATVVGDRGHSSRTRLWRFHMENGSERGALQRPAERFRAFLLETAGSGSDLECFPPFGVQWRSASQSEIREWACCGAGFLNCISF